MHGFSLLTTTALALLMASAGLATPVANTDAAHHDSKAHTKGAESKYVPYGTYTCDSCSLRGSFPTSYSPYGQGGQQRGGASHGDVNSALSCLSEAADALTPQGGWGFKVGSSIRTGRSGSGYGGQSTVVKASGSVYDATPAQGSMGGGYMFGNGLQLNNFQCTNGGTAQIKCYGCRSGYGGGGYGGNGGYGGGGYGNGQGNNGYGNGYGNGQGNNGYGNGQGNNGYGSGQGNNGYGQGQGNNGYGNNGYGNGYGNGQGQGNDGYGNNGQGNNGYGSGQGNNGYQDKKVQDHKAHDKETNKGQ